MEFAAYDLFVLRRAGAEQEYTSKIIAKAEALHVGMDEAAVKQLELTIIDGLPGSGLSHGREGIRAAIADYDGLTAADLQANLITFLKQVASFIKKQTNQTDVRKPLKLQKDPPYEYTYTGRNRWPVLIAVLSIIILGTRWAVIS